jgi:NADPH:quinone reductase-like Zn-dependent oxidoreductase
MRAVVQDRYGPPDVLHIEDVPKPEPGPRDVLIRVHASTVSQTDTHVRAASIFVYRLFLGLRRPRHRTLGVDVAGVVEAVGPDVREFKPGDAVFGNVGFNAGAHAEYAVVPARGAIAHKPSSLTFEEAASICDGAQQALATLRRGRVGTGTRLVVYGASGSLGTAAVQIAKHWGAHVTGVTSTGNVDLVRSLGADDVIDYKREDLTARGPVFDVVIDAVGKYAFFWGRRALKPGGVYVETDFGPHKLHTLIWWFLSRFVGGKHLRFGAGSRRKRDVEYLRELVDAGVFRPVIDSVYPMEQVVDAHRHVEGWHKVGNVVLRIAEG